MVNVVHPAYKAGQRYAKGWEREGARGDQVRMDELGPLLVFVLLTRASDSLQPSWASRLSKVAECCLVLDLGFP